MQRDIDLDRTRNGGERQCRRRCPAVGEDGDTIVAQASISKSRDEASARLAIFFPGNDRMQTSPARTEISNAALPGGTRFSTWPCAVG